MPEWDWVEHSDNKNILIAQKGGKQGIIRKDGSVFLEPKYKNQNQFFYPFDNMFL